MEQRRQMSDLQSSRSRYRSRSMLSSRSMPNSRCRHSCRSMLSSSGSNKSGYTFINKIR